MGDLKDKERDLARQLETTQQEVTFRESEIGRLTTRLETVQSCNETLEREIGELRGQLSDLNSKMNEGADETVKSKQQKDKADLVIVDLKNNLTLAKDENKRVQNEIGQARKDFLAEQ